MDNHYEITSDDCLGEFWGEGEDRELIMENDLLTTPFSEPSSVTEKRPFMSPKEVQDNTEPSLFVKPTESLTYLQQLEESVNLACRNQFSHDRLFIDTKEEVINQLQSYKSHVDKNLDHILQVFIQYLPDLEVSFYPSNNPQSLYSVMTTHYFETNEENELGHLLDCIHFLFSAYQLFNQHPYEGYDQVNLKPSVVNNRIRSSLSPIWNDYMKENDNATTSQIKEESEQEEMEVEQTEVTEETVTQANKQVHLSLFHYYKILRYLCIFRERPIGRRFSSIFNLLFIPLFAEFYVSIFLIGIYSREKPCFAISSVKSLLDLV